MKCIDDSSYDFVLSSHCIEHLANPLKGIKKWIRVLKQEGLLVLVIPHKNGTFDHLRPVTSLAHFIQDFDDQTDEGYMTHLEEIVKLHDLSKDPEAGDLQCFQERSKLNIENSCLHHHVFDTSTAIEVVNYMELQIFSVEVFNPYHIVIIAKKQQVGKSINNDVFRGVSGPVCWQSSFPSDNLENRANTVGT